MTGRFLAALLEVSISVSAVAVLLLLSAPLLSKRFAAKWRCAAWLLLAVRLLVPVNFHFPQPPVSVTVPAAVAASSIPVSPEAAPPASTPVSASAAPVRTVGPEEILFAVWLSGAALFLARRFGGYFVFLRKVRKTSVEDRSFRTREAFRSASERARAGRKVPVGRCGDLSSPMTAGFFRPFILLPDTDYTGEELEMIFRHELAHIGRGDVWFKLLLACANASHWFNPLVWLMARKAGEDAELACDSAVVEGRDAEFRKRYGETILSAVRKGNVRTAFSTGFGGGVKSMKQRIRNILDMGKKRRGTAALCAVLLAAGVLGASVAFGAEGRGGGAVRTPVSRPPVSSAEEQTQTVQVSDYTLNSIPSDWKVEALPDGESLSFQKNGEEIGSFSILAYDPQQPISQFEGNHAETLSTKKLEGLSYPAEEAVIRRTQPAAANDPSYVDELHIYLIPGDGKVAYDLYFDSSKVDEKTALQIAATFGLVGAKIVDSVDDGLKSSISDIDVTNEFISEDFSMAAVFGSLKSDPRQGVAVVFPYQEGSRSAGSAKKFLTPEKHGAVRAEKGSLGAKASVCGVAADDGYEWVFNVFNGFDGGHAAKTGSASDSGFRG